MDKIRRWMFRIISTTILLDVVITAPAQDILNNYVKDGLRSNLTVQQLDFDYEKALWGLKEAKRLYGPVIDAVGSYTRNFRRPFSMPPVDPGNPVSLGLNEMLKDIDANNIEGDKIYFPVPNQYTGGVQITQTVFSPEIKYNQQVKANNSYASKAKLEDFKIQLEADMRSAYLQYLQAYFVHESIQQGLTLAKQNLASVERLIAAQKATKDALYKAKANVSNVETQVRNAINNKEKCRFYFNFLLNREITKAITVDSMYVFNGSASYHMQPVNDTAKNGYQLDYIHYLENAAAAQKSLINANKLPDIQFSAFAGIRGQEISFDNSQLPISQLQLSLKWNLFNAGVNKAKYKQADIQQKSLQVQYSLQQQALLVKEATAYNDMHTALNNYASVKDNYANANVYYNTVEQKFKLGMATILELIDAEEQLLQSDIDRQIWFYNLQINAVGYLKQTGKAVSIVP